MHQLSQPLKRHCHTKNMIADKYSIRLIEKSFKRSYVVVSSCLLVFFLLHKTQLGESSRYRHTKCSETCCQIKVNLWLGDNFSSPIRRSSWETNVLVLRLLSCFKNIFPLFCAERKRFLWFTKFRTIIFYETCENEIGIQQASGPATNRPIVTRKRRVNDFKHPTWVFNVFQRRSFISIPNVIYLQCCRLAKITLLKNVSGEISLEVRTWNFAFIVNTLWKKSWISWKGSTKSFMYFIHHK